MSPPTSLSLRQEALLRANRARQQQLSSYSSSDDEDDDCAAAPVFALGNHHNNNRSNSNSNNNTTSYHHQQHLYGYASSTAPASTNSSNILAAPTAAPTATHPMAASEPALMYSSSNNNNTTMTMIPGDQQIPFHASNNTSNNVPTTATSTYDLAQAARQEWRQYGSGVTQVLEEKRRAGPLQVRVTTAQERTDVSGSKYTTYVIQLIDNSNNRESLMEHRYSEFNKLHSLLQQHSISVDATFPHKHWAGRVGNWTPSLQWAPEKHAALIQYRTQQLDLWLVHVVERYNQHHNHYNNNLPQVARNAIYEFLFVPPKLPCDRVNPVTVTSAMDGVSQITTTPKWQWNNPFATTLGSTIRQATCTVQYMCCGGGSSNNNHNNNHHHHHHQQQQKAAVMDADQSIPLDLLQAAHGLCFMTVFKAGLVVSGRFGTGLVIARLPSLSDNEVRWSAPVAVATAGMGWGAQVGGDVTHYLIVLTKPKAVQDMVSSSSVTLGAELGVAVGPVGRGANSHVQTGDWTLHSAYSYAHSQGLFVGISLEGSVVRVRDDVNAKFYGQACNAPDLLQQAGPTAAQPLYAALEQAMRTEIREGAFRPSEMFSPGRNTEVSAAESWKNRLALGAVSPPNGVANSYYSVNAGPVMTMGNMYNGPSSLADAATPSPSMPRQR